MVWAASTLGLVLSSGDEVVVRAERENEVRCAVPRSAPQCPTVPRSAPQCPTVLHSAPQCPAVPHSAPQCPAVPCSAPQCLQCPAVPHSAPQCPAVPQGMWYMLITFTHAGSKEKNRLRVL